MILDTIEGFDALTRSGMRVVRARYVDSAEDAIAFSARREARDERPIPIVLRAIVRPRSQGVRLPPVGPSMMVRRERLVNARGSLIHEAFRSAT